MEATKDQSCDLSSGESKIEKATGSQKRQADGNATREKKRRKWEAKQARRQLQEVKESERQDWVRINSSFAAHVSENDIGLIKSDSHSNLFLKESLTPYFDIQDGPPTSFDTSCPEEQLFIAEGTETIRILINQSSEQILRDIKPITIKSIFVKPSLLFEPPVLLVADIEKAIEAKKQNDSETKASPQYHVLVGSEATLSSVAGFHIARGALACGVVPSDRDEAWLENFLRDRFKCKNGGLRLLVLDGICDTSNLGSMIRCASVFGIDAVILSNDCCDAWYRRSIRVSMGHIFLVPVVRVSNLDAKIRQWTKHFTELIAYAAVVDPDADVVLEELDRGQVPRAWMCIMGNEGRGISSSVQKACTKRIRINMVSGVDSLSVPIATGILLHGLQERETKL
jgi:tRNA G18 (ribose-2'-O)-methylase SpoU